MTTPLRKKVVLLGSTGSIGTSTLKVAEDISDRMELVGLAAHRSVEALADQVATTGVKRVSIGDESQRDALRALVPDDVEILSGENGLVDLVAESGADMVLVAIVGTAGLRPALAAIECGMDLAVASKEILVMAGEKVMEAAREKGVSVLPVDSEHNAIFQECRETHPHRLGRAISNQANPRASVGDGGSGTGTPDLGDGSQDQYRLSDALQQRLRDD